MNGLAHSLPRLWYRARLAWPLWPLLPFSWLFRGISAVRRGLFRSGYLRSRQLSVPVIVVGNLTVGGSGKTPFVIWLVGQLRARGWRPGVISRGYGAQQIVAGGGVMAVVPDTPAALAGDEPVLLARRCQAPVYIGRDRAAAGEALLAAHPQCNVIIADDGLQHYRLRRCAEVVMFDGRGVGNGHLLPAGPLREPLMRLRGATAIVWNCAPECHFSGKLPLQFSMHLAAGDFYALHDPNVHCPAVALRGRRLHALAGIGDPRRFFAQLATLGLEFTEHPFPDHHHYTLADLDFARDGVLLMTEKDAVKCAALPVHEAWDEVWVLPVDAQLDAGDASLLLKLLVEKLDGCTPA